MEKRGIELEQAVDMILQYGNEVKNTEIVSIMEANSRILAEDIYSPIDNPPFDRSPLDGFALRSEDLEGVSNINPKNFTVVDTIYAGRYSAVEVKAGQAVRIMTGAPMPSGTDCVIRKEDVKEVRNSQLPIVIIDKKLKHHENFCFKGEDVEKGTLILHQDEKISFIEQGILSSLGINTVKVYTKPKVAIYVTGDELIAQGVELKPGKIYDSNLQLLYARLSELGFTPIIAKYLPDDPHKVAMELKDGIEKADFIVTTGGVSVGDKDIFHDVLPLLGAERLFWGVNLKPGTPAMFSIYKDKPMFHLSGNPFAVATTFELLVRPYLSKISGDKTLFTRRKKAILNTDFTKESKGRRFIRAKEIDGFVYVPTVEKHSSGILSSMKGCNCLIDIPANSGKLYKDWQVDIILL